MRDILQYPIWKKSELGLPLPDNKHAVSVALPSWNDVINYEEKESKCLASLRSIYPRFGLNPLLKDLTEIIKSENCLVNEDIWPYPDEFIALKAKRFCDKKSPRSDSRIKRSHDLTFLITKGYASNLARSFWQHTGLGASSREASIRLGIENAPEQSLVDDCKLLLLNRIAQFTNTKAESISLTSSGMSAMYAALEIIYEIFPNKPTLQIGFPYVDVLKLPEKIFNGAKIIIEENCEDIEAEIKKYDPAALIVELPSNPMLRCVNIKRIKRVARKLDIPIITDDTIGSNFNINSLKYSDIVFTSLTKIFSGSGDILAGSLILNPESKWIKKFNHILKNIRIPKLSNADIVSLEKVTRDNSNRIIIQNENCLKLKKNLENHKSIKNLFHPENCANFNSILKPNGGYGCLLSFELKGGIDKARSFYDSLKISKGPSLGNYFTLVCPYVQLAHYNELEWAESFGIPSHLIRVSVGIEDNNYLWNVFSKALDS